MNREQLIRTAMQAIDAEANAIDPTTGNVLVNYARAAVDALFPQIIYVNELIDLPEGSLLVGRDGKGWYRTNSRTQPWRGTNGGGYGSTPEDLINSSDRFLRYEGPLTVVWQP